jgi:large subunit ribosomal protein L21
MKAVIKTGGKQYLVKLGQKIKIEKVDKNVGDTLIFEEVLMIVNDNDEVEIGAPFLKEKVEGKIIDQAKAKKIIVFKYKAKKRYKVKKGHRQLFSLVEITKIANKEFEAPKKVEKKTEKKVEPKLEKPVAKKKATKKVEKETKEEKKETFFE